ncbi:Aspartate-semialdehyde dehydrogenase [Hondaea fermentalgiana]|uniref:aspartate-semialdehyde dehydrogenase n=1 Tax=Hondaea fermentalgiana TaxID=2315210 RepID=A0A2R5GDI4_9STRA|nr:Aspartate-semialdehyde dehydrogenase [Hondaea fermentalgiana]|eukprot:GBG29007.1 Aspartate-semialdehyde dehydrogenase [Hondaea fermentalgiana]
MFSAAGANLMNAVSKTAARQFSTSGGVSKKPVVAIAGSTGAVGQELLDLIKERSFPFADIKLLASARSAGKTQDFMGKTYTVEELKEDSFEGVDIAFFSAGGGRSKQFAPAAAKAGAVVIDNSSAYRMDPEVPLVVPEVNPDAAFDRPKGIIANPNCSTIIMNMVVWPLHQKAGVERVVVSTYQAASGAGAAAMEELEQQAKDWVAEKSPVTQDIFGRQYIFNLFSHNSDVDQETGYNEEETKMIKETKKIFSDPNIQVTATCIRVPVLRAHCESINVTLKNSMTEDEARELLANSPGVSVQDDRVANKFPEPLASSFKDDCFVGRIRHDVSQPEGKGLDMFVAGDQIRKGAALNAIQIAELLMSRS